MKKWGMMCLVAFVLSACASNDELIKRPADRQRQVDALVELGVGYLKHGEYTRAKDNLNKALELDQRSAAAHNALALIFWVQQEFKEAETQFKLALRYDSKFTRTRNNYGTFLLSQGRYHQAIDQLNIASKDQFYDERAAVFQSLGVGYLQLKDKKDAEDAFVHSLSLNPRQPRALLELAGIRYDQQNYVASRQLLRRYQQVAKDDAGSLWLCVRLARVFQDRDEEASCALALRNIYPASEEFKQYQKLVKE